MKFVLSLITMLSLPILTFAAEEKTSTYTYEQEKCSGEEDAFLRGLEEELANCKVQMPDVPSTNKLFEKNYKKYNDKVKRNFDTLVKAYYACAHDIVQHSDYGSVRGGTMYNTEAIATASFWIRDVVKKYLYQARIECDDKAGFDSLE